MMKKVIYCGIVVIIGLGVFYGLKMIDIAAGYSAKILCSCYFVSGRNLEDVKGHELKQFHYISHQIKAENHEAVSGWKGIYTRRAIYRKGLGCTLVPDGFNSEHLKAKSWQNPITNPDSLKFDFPVKKKINSLTQEKLMKTVEEIFTEPFEKKRNTRAVLVIWKDSLLMERYAEGFNRNSVHTGWSMTKSVMSVLTGILSDENMIHLNDSLLVDFWRKTQEDGRQRIKLKHLLNMNSGLEFEEEYSKVSDATKMLFNSESMGLSAAEKPLIFEPGEHWSYSSGTSNIISMIYSESLQKINTDPLEFAEKKLFHPLGMKTAIIERDAFGNLVGSSFMHATARDWALFGRLMLNQGMWGEKRILSKEWVEFIKTPVEYSPGGRYGGHFWLNAGENGDSTTRRWPELPSDLILCLGYEGQMIAIIPSEEMIIVRLGQSENREVWKPELFIKDVLQNVKEDVKG